MPLQIPLAENELRYDVVINQTKILEIKLLSFQTKDYCLISQGFNVNKCSNSNANSSAESVNMRHNISASGLM